MTDIELRLTADVAQATKGVGSFRKEYEATVKAIEKPLKQIGAFRELEDSLESIEKQSRVARDRVRDFGNELASASNPSKALTASYRDAVSELQRLTRAETLAQNQLAARRRELQAARIDTSNLSGEQRRLTGELSAAARTEGRNALAAQNQLLAQQQRQAQEAAAAGLIARRESAIQGIRAQSAALGQLAREQRLSNLEEAKAGLGVGRYRQLESELARIRNQYQLLRASGNLTTRELAIAQQAYTRRIRETTNAMSGLAAEQQRLRGGGSFLPGLVSGVGAAYATGAAIKGIAAQADAYSLMNARLKLATDSQQEFTTAQAELARIAQATQSPISSLVTLYGRISRPLKEAGRSQADILKVTEAVATSFRVSGATAEESQNGVIQFAQALGAGALRGEEFNSVAEQAPRLMQALAASIGVPVGALKEMATQGLLTADVVSDALVSQIDVLRREAETLPETVGGAMTALADKWQKAIGQTNVQPLIDSINKLGETISDPVVVENLVALASALATLAGTAVEGGSELVDLGKRIAFISANSQGLVTDLDLVDQQIADLDRSIAGSGLSTTIDGLLYSKEELQAKRDALAAFRASIVEEQTGLNAELEFLAEVGAAAAEAGRQKEVDANTKYIGELKKLQDEQVANAKKAGKALLAEEKKATAELEKVRKDRLDIDKRYKEALAGLEGEGEASYNAAQDLKVGARNALQSGDIEGAQAQAQAALKMLQDLAAAGENTYGFAGFIQELQAIELAANDIEQTNAENKIKAIREQIKSLEADAAKLKEMPLSIKSDEASIEAVRSQIQQLVIDMSNQEIVLPVRVAHPDGPIVADLPPDPGFAAGGWTGPGSKYKPAGIVHADEHVQPKRIVNEPGALSFLEQIRRNGFRNTISQLQASMAARLAGYAEGGPVSARALPAIPTMNPALLAGPSFPDLGRVAFDIGGESVSVYTSRDEALNLQRLAVKFGSARK